MDDYYYDALNYLEGRCMGHDDEWEPFYDEDGYEKENESEE